MFTIEYPTRGAYGAVTREAPSVIIDDFYSASWTERFWDIGEAQLELPMKYYALALDARRYPNGHYLHFSESERVMNLCSSRVVTKRDDPRIILYYKSLENFLSFRRVHEGPMGWPYYSPPVAGVTNYTLLDMWRYYYATRYRVPSMQYYKDPRISDDWIGLMRLDFNVGDTVLDVTKASCMRTLPFRKRHGFQIKVEGEEKRWWNMYITAVDAPDPLPDWTDYIEALEFGIDSSKYANAALVIAPKIEETKNAQGVYDGYREIGKTVYDSPTYYEPGYVADWNRVEKKIEYQLDGKDYKEATAMMQYITDTWGQIGGPNDPGTAKKLVKEQSSVRTVATTPATISKALKYGRDYRLGTMFQWTPYAGAGILDTAWFDASTSFEALVTEYTWTIDDTGVIETPGITM